MKPFCSVFAQRLITGIIGSILLGALYFYAPPLYFSLLIVAVGLWITVQELPPLVSPENPSFLLLAQKPLYWGFTAYYVGIQLYLLIRLNHDPATQPLVLLTLLLCFAHDGAAYGTGKLFGRFLLAPKTSPHKTWEGCLGGFLAVWFILFYLSKETTSLLLIFLIAICISVAATMGDLFESYLKRRAHVKDSGTLLPGQGGLLDRIDSILFVIPLIYFAQNFLLSILNLNCFNSVL